MYFQVFSFHFFFSLIEIFKSLCGLCQWISRFTKSSSEEFISSVAPIVALSFFVTASFLKTFTVRIETESMWHEV